MEDADATADLVDEVLEHVLGDDVVGDHAVPHRLLRRDVPRRPTEHEARFLADRDDARARRSIVVSEGDHRGLGEDDPFAAHIDDDVGRAEVDADLLCENVSSISNVSAVRVLWSRDDQAVRVTSVAVRTGWRVRFVFESSHTTTKYPTYATSSKTVGSS